MKKTFKQLEIHLLVKELELHGYTVNRNLRALVVNWKGKHLYNINILPCGNYAYYSINCFTKRYHGGGKLPTNQNNRHNLELYTGTAVQILQVLEQERG